MHTIVFISELAQNVKDAVLKFFTLKNPDVISFPFKGRHMKGFFFNWNNTSYLIIKSEVVNVGEKRLELNLLNETINRQH